MRYTKLPPVCLDPGADTEAVDNPEGIVLMRGGVGREGTVLVLELENLRVKINKHQAFHGKWKNYFLKSCLYIIDFNLLNTKTEINNDFCHNKGLVSKEIYFLSYGCTNL